jgi:TonB family protein
MIRLIKYVLFLSLLPAVAFSQELQLVKDKPNALTIEQYHVLTANPKIRQGLYQKYAASKLVMLEQGYYKNNQKDSTWSKFDFKGRITEQGNYAEGVKTGLWKTTVYYNDTGVTVKEGNYLNGEMTGLWTFNNADGSLSYKYDFIQKAITEYGKNEEPSTIIDQDDTLTATLDKPAVHIGGTDTLLRLLSANLRVPTIYPVNGRLDLNSISGNYKVLVSFDVNESGRLENYKILRSAKKPYDDEAVRVIKLWDDGNWVPGFYKGHAVKVIEVVPVVFNISVRNFGTTIVGN